MNTLKGLRAIGAIILAQCFSVEGGWGGPAPGDTGGHLGTSVVTLGWSAPCIEWVGPGVLLNPPQYQRGTLS